MSITLNWQILPKSFGSDFYLKINSVFLFSPAILDRRAEVNQRHWQTRSQLSMNKYFNNFYLSRKFIFWRDKILSLSRQSSNNNAYRLLTWITTTILDDFNLVSQMRTIDSTSTTDEAARFIRIFVFGRYLYLITFCIGMIGNVCNLIVFSRPRFRTNSCSIYFIAYSINNFMNLTNGLLLWSLTFGFEMNYENTNIYYCKTRRYFTHVNFLLSSCLLTMASINRYARVRQAQLTPNRHRYMKFCEPRTSYIITTLTVIFSVDCQCAHSVHLWNRTWWMLRSFRCLSHLFRRFLSCLLRPVAAISDDWSQYRYRLANPLHSTFSSPDDLSPWV